MSGHLERRAPITDGVARNGSHSFETGQATEISELTFGEATLEYSTDMPSAFRSGAKASTQMALDRGHGQARSGGELVVASSNAPTIIDPHDESTSLRAERAEIASSVRQLEKARKSAGRVVQRRIGWRATPDRVIITIAERELGKNPNGTFSPVGPWLVEVRRTFKEASGKASKRTGVVPADSKQISNDSTGDGNATRLEQTVMEKFPDGSRALGALPAAVRSSAIARVPSPERFEGQLLEFADGATGSPTSWKVTVLRMDVQRAVVISATREVTANAWAVSQAIYNLMEPEFEQA